MKEIKLTNCQRNILVDDEDYDRLMHHNWYLADNQRIIFASIKNKSITIGKFILGNASETVDHKNLDIYDNQKENLRFATYQQNNMNRSKPKSNTSGYKGVTYRSKTMMYEASIMFNGISKHLGTFFTAIEAAKAYNKAALKRFGSFANINNLT